MGLETPQEKAKATKARWWPGVDDTGPRISQDIRT